MSGEPVYVDPDAEVMSLGECVVPRWEEETLYAFQPLITQWGVRRVMFYADAAYVKRFVYQHRSGQIDAINYSVDVVFTDGETQEWIFGPHVGWPIVEGVQTNNEYWQEVFR